MYAYAERKVCGQSNLYTTISPHLQVDTTMIDRQLVPFPL